jgi:hypothetical protein
VAPELLLAAAINAQGNIDLPVVRNGYAKPEARVEFSLRPCDKKMQRQYWTSMISLDGSLAMITIRGDQEDMDMTSFAECVERRFGRFTPSLFRFTGRRRATVRRTDD